MLACIGMLDPLLRKFRRVAGVALLKFHPLVSAWDWGFPACAQTSFAGPQDPEASGSLRNTSAQAPVGAPPPA